jgi:hypothetical protein
VRLLLDALVISSVAFLGLLGCGIPSVGFVAAPEEGSVRIDQPLTSPRIEFGHNRVLNNTEDFSGYEIYYRLYDDGDDDQTGYEDDRDSILAEPVQPGTVRLRERDYRRVVAGDQETVDGQSPPLILVPNTAKGIDFTVSVSFQPGAQVEPEEAEISYLSGVVSRSSFPAARSIEQPGTQQPKGFLLGEYNTATDVDLAHFNRDIDEVIENGDLFVALYVLGFGIDGATFQPLYSRPVFLEYVNLQPAQ